LLRLLAGNHDSQLAGLLNRCRISTELLPSFLAGPHLLLHGDSSDEERARAQIAEARARGGPHFHGARAPRDSRGRWCHECEMPVFPASADIVILPAFSHWAAGANIRRGAFLSALAAATRFETAHALLGGKTPARAIVRAWKEIKVARWRRNFARWQGAKKEHIRGDT